MSIPRIIKIASRTSALALWQTNEVKTRLEQSGYSCQIIPVESTGDLQLTQPIYALGVSGVFTKQLDAALLNQQADIAVHSLKDVPTQLAKNIILAAVLERGAAEDIVIVKSKAILESNLSEATVATSSLRRRAQWLSKYPKHKIVPIRGNVQTRLKKFSEAKEIDAVIFAKAGLERLNLLPENAETLYWMLPAPAQGVIGIACREDDDEMKDICEKINHQPSFITSWVERQFLQTLMGGCSVPVSALAHISGSELEFEGAMHSFDGTRVFRVHIIMMVSEWQNAGTEAAEKLLRQPGAAKLIEEIRNKKWDEEGALN